MASVGRQPDTAGGDVAGEIKKCDLFEKKCPLGRRPNGHFCVKRKMY